MRIKNFYYSDNFSTIIFIESEKNRFNHECHLNVTYGDSLRQKFDIYGEDLKPDSPLFVFIHGGYWQEMNKWSSAYVVAPLVAKGIRVMVVDYDLCPTVTIEEIVAQAKKCFMWISDYIAKNSIKTVSFAGHSAGAHLVANSLTLSFMNSIAADVKIFAYYISGVYDLNDLRYLKCVNQNNLLSLNDNNVHELSPQFQDFSHLKVRQICHYVLVGEFESEAFKKQSKDFAEGPLKNLPSVTFKILNKLDHFDIAEKLSEADYEITELIIKNSFDLLSGFIVY